MSSMDDLKRLGRHLLGRPSSALRYEQQRMPANIRVSFHSDFEADRARRKATTGMFQGFGRHPIKTTSSLRVLCSETWSIARVQAYLRDLGIDLLFVSESDSSTGKTLVCRRGLGRQRHVQTRYLWIQDMVEANSFATKKVPTADNITDILTKAIDRKTLDNTSQDHGFRGSASKQVTQTDGNSTVSNREAASTHVQTRSDIFYTFTGHMFGNRPMRAVAAQNRDTIAVDADTNVNIVEIPNPAGAGDHSRHSGTSGSGSSFHVNEARVGMRYPV